jgi:hypothetical protein
MAEPAPLIGVEPLAGADPKGPAPYVPAEEVGVDETTP